MIFFSLKIMSDRKLVIYAGRIRPAKFVLGMFNGTEDFVIANRFFQRESHYTDKDDITKAKELEAGLKLPTPRIWWKDPTTRAFTSNYIIVWADDKEDKNKHYYFFKPPNSAAGPNFWKRGMNLSVSTNDKDHPFHNAEKNLIQFDYQLSIAMQVLLFANAFGINIGAYGTGEMSNKDFFNRFAEDIDTMCKEQGISPKAPLIFDDAMIDSFEHAPPFGKEDGIPFPAIESESGEEPQKAFKTVWDSIKDSYGGYLSKKPLKTKCPPCLQNITRTNNCVPCPTFRRSYQINREDDKYRIRFDTKITLEIKVDKSNPNYNPDIKEDFLTHFSKKTGFGVADEKFTAHLWGGTPDNLFPATKGQGHTGLIFLRPMLNFKYYKNGTPTTKWKVIRISTKKTKVAVVDDFKIEGEVYSDSEEENEEMALSKGGAVTSTADSDDGYEDPTENLA